MTQFLMALFGLTSMAFALSNGPRRRAWAPMIGLFGQPFWAHFAYTVVYIRAICVNNRTRP